MALTVKQIYDLDNSMSAAQSVLLGTTLNDILFANIPTPAVGTVTNMSAVKYTTAPIAISATGIKAALTLTASAQPGVTAGITNPDVPRNVTVKGNAAGIVGNVVVYGTNFSDVAINETIALNGATEVAGNLAFKTVTSIDFPAQTHVGTDTVSVGISSKIGFPAILTNAALCISHNFNGSNDAGTVTGAANIQGSVYAVAGTLDGVKTLDLVFLA